MNYLVKKFLRYTALHIKNETVQIAAAGCYGIFEVFGFIHGAKLLTSMIQSNMKIYRETKRNARP